MLASMLADPDNVCFGMCSTLEVVLLGSRKTNEEDKWVSSSSRRKSCRVRSVESVSALVHVHAKA